MRPLPKPKRRKTGPSGALSATDQGIAPATRRARKRRKIIWAGAIIAVVLGTGFGAHVGLNRAEALAAAHVSTSVARSAEFAEFVPVTAQVVPAETNFLDSVEGGRVTEVHVEEGATVKVGTPLVTLKNIDLELAVIAREAQYAEQLSNLARAQIDFEQNSLRHDQSLAETELQIKLAKADLARRLPQEKTGVPLAEIERLQTELAHHKSAHKMVSTARQRDGKNAKRNLSQLAGSVGRMEESLKLLRGSLGGLVVTAPIDGQVTSLGVKVGEVVARGARLGQIDKVGSFKLRARVDEHYLGRLAIGQQAAATVGSQPQRLTVQKIYPNVVDRQFEVDLTFGNAPKTLRRGQSLRIRVELGESEEVLTIDNGPFYEQTGGLWVFVVSADGRSAERRPVNLGRRNTKKIEVLSGLEPGDLVMTSSYAGLTDKTNLRIRGSMKANNQ